MFPPFASRSDFPWLLNNYFYFTRKILILFQISWKSSRYKISINLEMFKVRIYVHLVILWINYIFSLIIFLIV